MKPPISPPSPPPKTPPPPPAPKTPPPPPGPKTVDQPRTIKQAAAELGIGYHKFRKLVAGHAVPCFRVGRSVKFFDRHIEAIKQQFEDAPKAAPVVSITRGRRVA
jgi:hypothetical protein